ncbi:MAG: hypothetical protein BMS9Abin22_303 [Gammaproteobacteria bacterium]|nr:MAG: hypothetical protein BMS9Abin22_303 [Gammaproteobacteria bacterium]
MKQGPNNQSVDVQQREALVSMTALYFIEEHALLPWEQLEDAKKSLQALFLRTSGEETMLRKLIDILKITRNIHQSFAKISGITTGISKCLLVVDGKIAALRQYLERFKVTAEENADFIGPFLSFSQAFLQKIETYSRDIQEYLELKEKEARYNSMYQIAREARERLKQRLSGVLGAKTHGEIETKIKEEIVASFDYGETESNLKYAMRESRNMEEEIHGRLAEIKAMCQMAMNPAMREQGDDSTANPGKQYEDVYRLFSIALRKHPRLLQMKDAVLELFKLYQNSYGMFGLDFNNLNKAIETMIDNTEAYFEAKEEDRDIMAKRDKLKKIEGLIPFLERTAETLTDKETNTYIKYSKKLSGIISEKKARWFAIGEELLRAKVQADAELSTRM